MKCRWATAVLALLAASACRFEAHTVPAAGGGGSGGSGAGGGGGGAAVIDGLVAVRVDPATATVTATPGTPATQAFRAFGRMASGGEQEITSRVSWSVDRVLLVPSIHGGLAKTGDTTGGMAVVTAQSGMTQGSARLMIRFASSNLADGGGASPPLPAAPAAPFGGPADAARAPQLVYPNDGVLLPPNLNGIEVHYRKGSASNTLFEVAFHNADSDVRAYTRCVPLGDGCVYRPSNAVWRQIAETNRGLGPVSVTERGTDDAGTAVGTSAAAALTFAKEDLRGGLYYWTTTLQSIERWDFGSTTQTTAATVVGPADGDGKTCVGCHALSRDGNKMVATLGGQNDGRLLLWDVARKTATAKPFSQQHSQFESWSPDGSAFVGMYTDDKPNHSGPSNLILFDGTTALPTGIIDLGGLRADHPDWSPDGNRIVFTSVDTAGSYTDQKPQKSGLAWVERAPSGTGWNAPMTLLPHAAGKNRYYPAIAPNGRLLVFNESTCPSGDGGADCDADTDPTARLYALPFPPDPSATPVALARANAAGVNDAGATALTNSYPKWAPFVFQLDEQHDVLWATFSSKRRYGLYPSRDLLYIWMVAVAPGAAPGDDPSYAAFCLPFQALDTSNHIAQWTTAVPPPVVQ